MRLLIVEDDRDIVKALTALFEHNNYSVDAVYNGNDGYDYAVGGSYDGIVMDIMMPGMDGLQVLHALRAAGIKTPVLLLTAKGDIEDKVNGLDAGADDYLPKPFAAAELLARVRAMLRRKENYQSDTLEFEGLSLDLSTFELHFGTESMRLVSREFQMLAAPDAVPRHRHLNRSVHGANLGLGLRCRGQHRLGLYIQSQEKVR